MENSFVYDTRLGKIFITDNGYAIIRFGFGDFTNGNICETELIKKAYTQLVEYLNKERKCFDFPILMTGTDFQKKVWQQLLKIPYGETKSYQQIAVEIGNKNATRAVGLANNKNPIAIIVPCHRVIGKNGSLTGYAGGLELKKNLLELEGVDLRNG